MCSYSVILHQIPVLKRNHPTPRRRSTLTSCGTYPGPLLFLVIYSHPKTALLSPSTPNLNSALFPLPPLSCSPPLHVLIILSPFRTLALLFNPLLLFRGIFMIVFGSLFAGISSCCIKIMLRRRYQQQRHRQRRRRQKQQQLQQLLILLQPHVSLVVSEASWVSGSGSGGGGVREVGRWGG